MYRPSRTRSVRVAIAGAVAGALAAGVLAGPTLAASDAGSPVGQARKAGATQHEPLAMRKAGGDVPPSIIAI